MNGNQPTNTGTIINFNLINLKRFIFLLIIVIFIIKIIINQSFAVVTPPNFGFKLDFLDNFFPGKEVASVLKLYGPAQTLLKLESGITIYRFTLNTVRFTFSVLVQVYNEKILDLYIPWPAYFLHDMLHADLIKKFSKHTKYFHHEGQSIYIWENYQGIKITYSGTCTITCFPLFLSATVLNWPPEMVTSASEGEGKVIPKSLLDLMVAAEKNGGDLLGP